jgi:DNA gyrase/topoisomerase IV subunit B
MSTKKFDLNIEKILEDWETYHAIREVISNAIDEEILTKTKTIRIFKDQKGKW